VTVGDPGFGTAAVQARLFDWLKANGFAREGHDALDVAMQHIELHAVQPTPADVEPSSLQVEQLCLLEPCRAAGAAFALRELMLHRIEAEQDLAGLILALDTMASALRKIERSQALDVVRLARQQHEQLQRLLRNERGAVDGEFLDVACRAPVELFVSLTHVRDRSESLAAVLRTYADSHAAEEATGGRPAQALLVALTQHLDSGGFTYAEIAELLPDGMGGKSEAVERVRKRAKSADRRKLVAHPRRGREAGNKPPWTFFRLTFSPL